MGFFHVKQGSHALLVLNMWYDSRKNEWSMICELRMRETKLEKKNDMVSIQTQHHHFYKILVYLHVFHFLVVHTFFFIVLSQKCTV